MQNVVVTKTDKAQETKKERKYVPYSEIWQSEDQVAIVLDMPAVEENSIQVGIKDNELKVEATTIDLGITGALAYREFHLGKYQRSFTVDGYFNMADTKAHYKNGQLVILIPKKQPQSIQVPIHFN
jgi:HSP20 family molecular chaperone IbpA